MKRVRWVGPGFLLFSALAPLAGAHGGDEWDLSGGVENVALAGGTYALEPEVAPRRAPQGEGYVLTPAGVAPREAGVGGACACFDLIFADDFESGDTGEWDLP
ncbi:MAG: hypothetical protein KDB94_10995 [Acidobacteria bacterium]|nr:hypothetical protein [Acidobacteriota bacterium]MCB9377177.1 hypothetical protein [Holophagales bacterium]